MQRTIEMYQRIIKNAPYGDYAPQCQFNIGLADEKQRKFTDAVDSYQLVLDNYPTSSVAADAQYQIGYAWMKSSISGDYDMGAAKKAVDAFQDYLVRFPDSDKSVQAQENIRRLGQKQTQGAFDIAKFYETQHNPRAAFIYYNEVVREDPNSESANLAKKRIQELRPIVEALPGGLGPDGSGNPAVPPPQNVASSGQPGQPGGDALPPGGPNGTPDAPLPAGTPETNSAPQTPAAGALPADANAPVTSSSPGETAASEDAPMPAATGTTTALPATLPAQAPAADPLAPTSAPAPASAPATPDKSSTP
jgi:outer membrane protein assembly factor BamD